MKEWKSLVILVAVGIKSQEEESAPSPYRIWAEREQNGGDQGQQYDLHASDRLMLWFLLHKQFSLFCTIIILSVSLELPSYLGTKKNPTPLYGSHVGGLLNATGDLFAFEGLWKAGNVNHVLLAKKLSVRSWRTSALHVPSLLTKPLEILLLPSALMGLQNMINIKQHSASFPVPFCFF